MYLDPICILGRNLFVEKKVLQRVIGHEHGVHGVSGGVLSAGLTWHHYASIPMPRAAALCHGCDQSSWGPLHRSEAFLGVGCWKRGTVVVPL